MLCNSSGSKLKYNKMANLVNTGKVKFFNESKGYGFITDNSGEEYFFHTSKAIDRVKKDDIVIYDLEPGKKGMCAVDVKLKS
jgi:CspA family cold shock protein